MKISDFAKKYSRVSVNDFAGYTQFMADIKQWASANNVRASMADYQKEWGKFSKKLSAAPKVPAVPAAVKPAVKPAAKPKIVSAKVFDQKEINTMISEYEDAITKIKSLISRGNKLNSAFATATKGQTIHGSETPELYRMYVVFQDLKHDDITPKLKDKIGKLKMIK